MTTLDRNGERKGYTATLQAAEKTLRRLNIYEPDPLIYQQALGLVRQASLNCYAYDVSASLPCITMAGTSASCLQLLTLIDKQLQHPLLTATAAALHATCYSIQLADAAALHAFTQRGEAWQQLAKHSVRT